MRADIVLCGILLALQGVELIFTLIALCSFSRCVLHFKCLTIMECLGLAFNFVGRDIGLFSLKANSCLKLLAFFGGVLFKRT